MARTGRTWPEWLRYLDALDAAAMSHAEIAKLCTSPGGGWWAQTISVGYERLRGLRELGGSREGSFAANKSRTVSATATQVRAAFRPAQRAKWLGAALHERRTTSTSSLRFDTDEGARISIWLTDKPVDKCIVAVSIENLVDVAARDRHKLEWGGHLDALASFLKPKAGK